MAKCQMLFSCMKSLSHHFFPYVFHAFFFGRWDENENPLTLTLLTKITFIFLSIHHRGFKRSKNNWENWIFMIDATLLFNQTWKFANIIVFFKSDKGWNFSFFFAFLRCLIVLVSWEWNWKFSVRFGKHERNSNKKSHCTSEI